MNRLKVLNLNSNYIKDIREVTVEFIPNVKVLDLGSNEIDFDTYNEFVTYFLRILVRFKQLTNLNVDENAFFTNPNIKPSNKEDENVIPDFIERLKTLEWFNGNNKVTV